MHTPPPPNPSPSSQYSALLPPSTMAAPLKPWRTEYAKSNRSTCKSCSSLISKDTLRIAKVVAATQFDGIMPIWYHAKCVLKKPGQIRTLNDVEGIDALRWEDQQKLRNYVDGGSSFANEGQINEAESTRGGVDGDYAIENAKSSRAGCKSCNEKIEKGQVRISTLVESGSSKFRGKVPAWRHAKCFLELGWWVRPLEDMPGWEDLSTEDQQAIKELAEPFIKGSQNKGSKRKVEETLSGPSEKIAHGKTGPAGDQKSRKRKKGENEIVADRGELVEKDVANKGKRIQKGQEKSKAEANPGITDKMAKEFEKKLEKQSKALWEIKDNLRKHVETTELRRMLEVNAQDSSGSEYDLRDRCADGMMFGTLGKCPTCDGPIEYHGGQYRCRGNISEWTKCSFTTTLPERLKAKWKIPDETENDYLKKWFKSQASKKETRLLLPQSPGKPTAKQEETAKKKLDLLKNAASGPLGGMTVTIVGKLEKSLAKWKQLIVAAGGRLLTEITSETNYVITSETELELEESRSKLQHAQNLKIHIVREAFLTDCIEGGVQLPVDQYVIETAGKLASIVKVKVKGRSAVHEETGLQDSGHILEDGRTIYNTTLNLSDLSTGINSYYIMQIIEDDKKKLYHLFRKWGRVGNSKIGSSKLDQYSKSSAINEFKRLFREKTGNDWESWENKQNFKKQPNKFYPLEIDYGVDDKTPRNVKILGSKSKLDPRVISLMKMLFDLETYKAAMMEFEINMSEMPLGKLSKRNIEQGFQVLTEIQNIICSNESRHGIKESSLIDASNRFFTLIPHVHPQAIRDEEVLKSKIQMLEALRDIEIASKLIGSVGEDTEEDPLDTNYKKLCCAILPLPHDSSDFQMVQAYLERTHAPTHTEWSLELEDVFAVDREKEYEAYAPVKEKLSNRMLLWHGSRTTNFVGILSQGLRIAPPEAPVTGYMFGKGVYFADLVSKSAQYCYTTKKNPTGLMLLSEVALGETYELKKAKYIEKPPSGKHSTKGLGKNKPLESEYQVWGDQVTVPCGRPVSSGLRDTELQYNEYIVYDTAQIKLQFLLKVRFKHKR